MMHVMTFKRLLVLAAIVLGGVGVALLTFPKLVVRAATPSYVALYESVLVPYSEGVETRPVSYHIRAATAGGFRVRANLDGDPRRGGQVVFRRIDSTRQGWTKLVSESAKSVTTQQRGALDSAKLHQGMRHSKCEDTSYPSEFLGRGQYLGYEVTKVRIASPGARAERWMVPALGCLTVFLRHESLLEPGLVQYAVEERAIAIDPIEPPASLTSVNPGFTQRDLANLLAAVAAAENTAVPEHLIERARKQGSTAP